MFSDGCRVAGGLVLGSVSRVEPPSPAAVSLHPRERALDDVRPARAPNMKICLVSQEYPPETGGGGIGTQTYLKAKGLSERGHLVHVVSASWDDEARLQQDGDIVIHRIPEPRLAVPGYELSSYWLAYSHCFAKHPDQPEA